jgi:two-component system response regulator FixJ
MTGRADGEGIVSIIDDDSDLGAALARMLHRQGYDATAFDDPRRFLAEATGDTPRCVVTDVMMGDLDGFALARQVRERLPTAAILFMTAWPQTRDAVEAVRDLGGLDYLEKPLDQDRTLDAVARGLRWSRKRHAASARLSPLSAREREVFALLVRGRTNKLVAAQLDISVKTVEDHRAAIMKKTGSFSLADLIDIDPARRGD